MTKKHFEAMADYIVTMIKQGDDSMAIEAVNDFALYLGERFNDNFDRARFDAWIEKGSK